MARDKRDQVPNQPSGDGRSQRGAPAELRSRVMPDFAATVQVTETERARIVEHLGRWQEDELILDVVRRVRAGKEATVYACTAHPNTGREVVAAKLYREYSLRKREEHGPVSAGPRDAR